MKRYRRSKKALSPVIATIILIAVTVAVSIAVAVWMGALTTGFMANEQLTITSANFVVTPGNVTLSVSNTGTTTVTITQVWNGNTPIAGATFAGFTGTTGTTLASNAAGTISFAGTFVSGNSYAFKLVSKAGNTFTYTAIAP